MIKTLCRSCLILLLVVAATVPAQSQSTDEETPQYRVEVVFFTQPSISPADEEQPTARPEGLTRAMAWPLRAPQRPGFGYEQLDPTTHQLGRAANRLDAQPGFTVHWHAAWIQPGLGRFQAQAVALPRELRAEGFDGWIRIYRERFLHAETHITQIDNGGELLARMAGSRRMRSDEQHYLDHPVLGVLVRVDPWEAEEAAGAD